MTTPLRFSPALRALCLFAFAYTVYYIFMDEPPGEVVDNVWDKAVHAVVYGGMGFLLWVATQGRWSIMIAIAIVSIGVADEYHQIFEPGRTSDFYDLVADTVGVTVVLLALRGLRRFAPQ